MKLYTLKWSNDFQMEVCEISTYIMYIAWTIEIVPKHCFKKSAYLCLIEMKRELHITTKHENA